MGFFTALSMNAGCTSGQTSSSQTSATGSKTVASTSTKLAVIPDLHKPVAVDNASTAKGTFYIEFSKKGNSAAYIAKVDDKKVVVFNGVPGKPYSNIFNLRLSPDGLRIAYVAAKLGKQCMVVDGIEGSLYEDISPPVFSFDSRHVAYKFMYAENYYIAVDRKRSAAFKNLNDEPQFSADSQKIAFVDIGNEKKPFRIFVSDLEFKMITTFESCGDQILFNSDRYGFASVCTRDDKKQVAEFTFEPVSKVKESALYDSVTYLSYSKDGKSLAYVADKAGLTYLVLDGREEQAPKTALLANPVVLPDNNSISIITGGPDRVTIHQAFNSAVCKENLYETIEDLVYDKTGRNHAYSAFKSDKWRIVVNGKEGPLFDRIIGPMFSPDGTRVVYRARQDDKRFVVVADLNGTTIHQHEKYELVYPPVFTADGGSVAYGTKDGKEIWWKVEKLK
jgi:Tol biopolymer transport system component